MSVNLPRRGGPKLKESQVYPDGYARRYLKLHCKWVAAGTNNLLFKNVSSNRYVHVQFNIMNIIIIL